MVMGIRLVQRGEHNIEHELSFTNHNGYVFHDSRGFESGNKTELEIVQDFVRRKSREKLLKDRLHAIWFVFVPLGIYTCKFTGLLPRYCIPMDNARPELELKYFEYICPDKNGTLMRKHYVL
jgi:hypothetical protein